MRLLRSLLAFFSLAALSSLAWSGDDAVKKPIERSREWELATHVVVGQVEKIEHADRKGKVISTEGNRFILEMTTTGILKGKGISPGDKLRLLGWRTGTQRQNYIPSAGRSRITVFLKKKGDEYEVLVPDGFLRRSSVKKKS